MSGYLHCTHCRAIHPVELDTCPSCGAANEALPVPEMAEQPRYELRPDCDGNLDDLVFHDVEFLRIERMNQNHWWIGVTMRGGKRVHVNLGAKRANVDATSWEE